MSRLTSPRCRDCGRFMPASLRAYFCRACRQKHELTGTPDWKMSSGDSRDFTPEPPAYLDPHFILRNRARVQIYLETGAITWPRAVA